MCVLWRRLHCEYTVTDNGSAGLYTAYVRHATFEQLTTTITWTQFGKRAFSQVLCSLSSKHLEPDSASH